MNPFCNYLQNFGSNSFLNQWIVRHDPRLALLEDMDWYFEDTGRSLEYVSDVVMELQELFLDLMVIRNQILILINFTCILKISF